MRNFGDLMRYNYTLQVYCPICKVSRVLDLKRQDPDRNFMHVTYRCKECRAVGEPLVGPANLFRK